MRRDLSPFWNKIVIFVATAFVLFHIYTAAFGQLPDLRQKAIHVMFAFILTFAVFQPRKTTQPQRKIPIYDIALILLVITSCINLYFKYIDYMVHIGESNAMDLFRTLG
jgi:TRAP-type uncharacterized transport system fused permease subunit